MTYNVTLLPHPELYAGINDWGFATTDINSAGVNDEVWPDTFDSSFITTPLISKYPMVVECPDFTIACEDRTFNVAMTPRKACVENAI